MTPTAAVLYFCLIGPYGSQLTTNTLIEKLRTVAAASPGPVPVEIHGPVNMMRGPVPPALQDLDDVETVAPPRPINGRPE